MAQEAAQHPLCLQNQKTCLHWSQPLHGVVWGRECVMPWELEGDLGPLGTEVDLPVEEVFKECTTSENRSLMLQQPTSKEHKRSSQGPTMPSTAEMHLKWVKKYGGRIHCGIQNKNC